MNMADLIPGKDRGLRTSLLRLLDSDLYIYLNRAFSANIQVIAYAAR